MQLRVTPPFRFTLHRKTAEGVACQRLAVTTVKLKREGQIAVSTREHARTRFNRRQLAERARLICNARQVSKQPWIPPTWRLNCQRPLPTHAHPTSLLLSLVTSLTRPYNHHGYVAIRMPPGTTRPVLYLVSSSPDLLCFFTGTGATKPANLSMHKVQ